MLERNKALRQWPEPHSRPGSGGNRTSPRPLAGPVLSSAGRVPWTRGRACGCKVGGEGEARGPQATAVTQTTHGLAGQAPDSRSGPLSPVPGSCSPSRRPGEAGLGTSLRLLPERAVCSQAREQSRRPRPACGPFSALPPARPVQTPHGPVTRPTRQAFLRPEQLSPLRPAARPGPPRAHPTGVSVPLVSLPHGLCVLRPSVRWDHFSQGWF